MSEKEATRKESHYSKSRKVIYVIGLRKMQNDLLAFFLEQKTGIPCLRGTDLSIFQGKEDSAVDPFPVVLFDSRGEGLETVLDAIESAGDHVLSRAHVALCNVDPALHLEEEAVMRGIKGFFYEGDSMDLLLKGVGAIFEGEFWVSRAIMSKCIVKQKSQGRIGPGGESSLTVRETEILAMVAVGIKNDEIADRLCISPHTVKTHIYNIFKKIEVPNRLQAALWAAQNL